MDLNITDVIDKLVILYTELCEIMEKDQENNWIRGIKACLRILKSKDNSNAKIKLSEVKSIYHTMYAGYGSFSEYFIWRENFDERAKANKRLDEIRDEIWNILEKIN